MKKLFLSLIALLCLLPAMAASKKSKRNKLSRNAITSVKVLHTPCFGRCATFAVQVDKKGMATFEGYKFLPDTGYFVKRVGKTTTNEIIGLCQKYRIDTCSADYENRIPDLPGLVFTVKYKNRTQKISNANFGPDFLKEISARLDDIGKPDSSWTRKTPPAKP
jgi:hypothetical protein